MTIDTVFHHLKQIIPPIDELDEDSIYDLIEQPLEEAYKQGFFPYKFAIDNGASKVCIFIQGVPEVIKIPLSSFEGETFCNAYTMHEEYEENTWDYCRLECHNYQEAKKHNLDSYFAREWLIGYLGNYPIYAQEKVLEMQEYLSINNEEFTEEEMTTRKQSAVDTCKRLNANCFHPIWVADFLEFYGEAEFKRLDNFIHEHSINDLRGANIGYLDGVPVLFDYSGFLE